jgi:hypothetical protein
MDHEEQSFTNTEVVAYTAIGVGVLVAVMYAAIAGIGSWAQIVVLAGIVLATIGVMIAMDPLRRE